MRTLLLVGLVATTAFAQAPESVSGNVYREKVWAYLYYIEAIVSLHDDGTYTSVMIRSSTSSFDWREGHGWVEEQDQGTYVYERTGSNTGTLRFTNPPDGWAGVEKFNPRELVFTSEKHGTLSAKWGWYDATGHFGLGTAADSAIMNVSNRGWASASKPMIVGVYVSDRDRQVLLRAIGPSLAQFDGVDAAEDTSLEILEVSTLPQWWQPIHATNDSWEIDPSWWLGENAVSPVASVGALVGAFPLAEGSKDAALVIELRPGAYTMIIRTKSETPKEVLGEVYIVP